MKILFVAPIVTALALSVFAQSPSKESRSAVFVPDLEKFKVEKVRKVKPKKKVPVEVPASTEPSELADRGFWLRFQARDVSRSFVSDISRDQVKVLVDGKPQDIENFQRGQNEGEIVFVLDTSPSSAILDRQIRAFVEEAVERLSLSHPISIWKFDGEHKLLLDRSLDRKQVRKALGKIRYREGTALYDLVTHLCHEKKDSDQPRTIVLLSDGVDTTSLKANGVTSLNVARRCNDVYYPVYLNTYPAMSSSSINPPTVIANIPGLGPVWSGPDIDEAEAERGREYLNYLLSMTGGVGAAFPQNASDVASSASDLVKRIDEFYLVKLKGVRPSVVSQVQAVVARPNLLVYTQSVIE